MPDPGKTIDTSRQGKRRIARFATVCIAASCLSVPAAVLAAAPLDAEERSRADTLARTLDSPLEKRSDHALGLQSVVIERESRKGAPATERRARVYQYDHERQAARLVRVDLNDDLILDSAVIDGHHLPLNDDERNWALQLVANDSELLMTLRAEQSRRGAVPFASLDELEVKASIFEPLDASNPCASERCALLSLFDDSRTVFATEPVVRYPTGIVTTLDAMDKEDHRNP